jgi:hypothetical protein
MYVNQATLIDMSVMRWEWCLKEMGNVLLQGLLTTHCWMHRQNISQEPLQACSLNMFRMSPVSLSCTWCFAQEATTVCLQASVGLEVNTHRLGPEKMVCCRNASPHWWGLRPVSTEFAVLMKQHFYACGTFKRYIFSQDIKSSSDTHPSTQQISKAALPDWGTLIKLVSDTGVWFIHRSR